MRKLRITVALGLVLTMALGTGAVAGGPDDEGVLSPITAHDHQHDGPEGHLPAVKENVDLVGKLDLFEGGERPGRISDVGVFGDYAYLGAFYKPDCEEGGVYVIDISNPAAPKEAGFIPTSPGAYVGEGVQVLDMNTEHFQGQVLLHNNENCLPLVGAGVWGFGGASLWDVSDPTDPQPLAQHVGDTDPSAVPMSIPHASHSVFGWQQGDRAYMSMVDNSELGETDIDILDITDPRNPELILETGMADFPQIAEDPPANGAWYYNHDMVVKQVGGRWLMLSNYWDGGYVILDVTGLTNDEPTVEFLRDTDFGLEPFAAEMGLPSDWIAEGNAHQGEFNRNGRFFLGADEDFDPFRNAGVILSGLYEGDSYSGTLGNLVPPVPPEGIEGGTQFVGQACGAATPSTPETPIALIERGGCTFTIKAQTVQLAGYDMGYVFNDKATDPDCESQVFMLAIADIPFLFVSRSTGLKLMNLDFTDPCATDAETPDVAAEEQTRMAPIFDGWGYLHLYDAKTMQELDHWALPETLDPAHAEGSGVVSIHEVAMDPKRNLAYLSHYSAGFRVVKFDREDGIQEVGAFIDEGGNDIWGVEVLERPGERGGQKRPLVLASDRDSGLYIFKYTG